MSDNIQFGSVIQDAVHHGPQIIVAGDDETGSAYVGMDAWGGFVKIEKTAARLVPILKPGDDFIVTNFRDGETDLTGLRLTVKAVLNSETLPLVYAAFTPGGKLYFVPQIAAEFVPTAILRLTGDIIEKKGQTPYGWETVDGRSSGRDRSRESLHG